MFPQLLSEVLWILNAPPESDISIMTARVFGGGVVWTTVSVDGPDSISH
jgi:hypothetical protein